MKMWGEAIRLSVYILNRVPTRALSKLTPYEARYGRKPNLSYVRVFGCLAYMKTAGKYIQKLEDRSKRVINLGKEPGTKGYRLYDPTVDRVYVSRDVTFRESESWIWDATEAEMGQFSVEFTEENAGDTGHQTAEENEVTTQQENTPVTRLNRDDYDDSTEPRRTRLIRDLYEETEAVDELYLMGVDEPGSYRQAVKNDNWRQAMEQEMESIEENETWKLMKLPPGQKTIGLKWVFKLKKNVDGMVIKHKARLVAKGYVQEQGVDYDEVYAPVTRLETVRLLLALSAKKNWEVHHLDVKTAFLNRDIKEDVFVTQPEGVVKDGKEQLVYKLRKAIYGLRQVPRAWYAKLNSYLEELGFFVAPMSQQYTQERKTMKC